MRYLYIDCGVHTGKSITAFLKTETNKFSPFFEHIYNYQEYDIIGFDPQPGFLEKNKELMCNNKVTLINKGVYVQDGILKFYIQKNKFSESSSFILRNKLDTEINIETVNLSRWLKENILIGDYTILKLDIEGMEYSVLRQIIDDNSINLINELYIEFHNRFKVIPIEDILCLQNDLKSLKHLSKLITNWP